MNVGPLLIAALLLAGCVAIPEGFMCDKPGGGPLMGALCDKNDQPIQNK